MLKEIINFCEKNSGNIYVYGAGYYGKRVGVWLDENNYEWKGFIETSRRIERLYDKSVLEFGELPDKEKYAFIVCAGKQYVDEIVEQIHKNKVDNYIIISFEQVQYIDEHNSYKRKYPINNYINVLLYHRVISLQTDPQLLAISESRFEEHVKYLKSNYRILRFEEDWSDVNERAVVLTFDDGYADNYLNALPILEKYQVPATIFVSTENIDTQNEMWWDELEALFLLNNNLPESVELLGNYLNLSGKDRLYQSYLDAHRILKKTDPDVRKAELMRLEEVLAPNIYPRNNYRMMTKEELLKLSQSEMITIGGHTVTHSCLANESIEKQRWEIETSKKEIEALIGKELEVFSYPFGDIMDYTDETCDIVKKSGYKKASIVKGGIVSKEADPYKIPRNLVRNWELETFRRIIERMWVLSE